MIFNTTITLSDLILAITAVFGLWEYHKAQIREFYSIDRDNRESYFRILDNRRDVEHYYHQKDINLEELKVTNRGDYNKILASEKEYFRFVHDFWKLSYIDKLAPRRFKKQWDRGPESGLQNPIHLQAWHTIIKDMDFVEKEAFVKYIEKCIQKGIKNAPLHQ